MKIARLFVILAAVAGLACAPTAEKKEKANNSDDAVAKMEFASKTESLVNLQNSNRPLYLTSSSLGMPVTVPTYGYGYGMQSPQCVLVIDSVAADKRMVLVSYNNCGSLFIGAPQIFQCKDGLICMGTTGDVTTWNAVQGIATPYMAAAQTSSAATQNVYTMILGSRTVNMRRQMANIGTTATSNTQEFTFSAGL